MTLRRYTRINPWLKIKEPEDNKNGSNFVRKPMKPLLFCVVRPNSRIYRVITKLEYVKKLNLICDDAHLLALLG